MIFVGVDWAEAHHDVHLADDEGRRLATARLPEGVEGIARFHELVGAHVQDPGEVLIGIETDRGLFVSALVGAGYGVYAVNPKSTSRYRDRHSTSGAKSDPGDAQVLCDMVRTDRHRHRLMAADSAEVEAIKVLARAHQSMVWSKGRQSNLLRSTLREFYPAALVAFDDLAGTDALEVLRIAPTPSLGSTLSRSKIAAALRRGGRQRRVDERTVEIQAALRSEQLEAPPAVSAAMGASVAANVAVLAEMVVQIGHLAAELSSNFRSTPRRRSGPLPARTRDHPRRQGAWRVRRRTEPLCHRQVSQELRRHVADHPGLRHQEGRACPPRAQPPPGRCHPPVGLRLPQLLTGRPDLLRRPTFGGRRTPPSPSGARKPPGWHPSWMPHQSGHLRRIDCLGPSLSA